MSKPISRVPGQRVRLLEKTIGEMKSIMTRSTSGMIRLASIAILLGFPQLTGSTATAQADTDEAGASEKAGNAAAESRLTAQQTIEAQGWIEQLGAREFAVRERAANNLIALGKDVVPLLREVVAKTPDAETRVRAKSIVRQLTEGDMQSRIADFKAGKDVGFKGWDMVQTNLGSSMAVRELFVKMMQQFPNEVPLFDGNPREHAIALEKIQTQIQNKLSTMRQDANRADVFALLLLASDRRAEGNALLEKQMIQIMLRPVATSIGRDAQVVEQFRMLMNRWMMKTSLANRDDILYMGNRLRIPAVRQLAVQTLGENASPDVLTTAMQILSNVGEPEDAEALRQLLDDDRLSSERYKDDSDFAPQVRDIAMLTIAMIRGVPLEKIGMPHISTHPDAGFIPAAIAYPEDAEESRALARKVIDALFEEESQPAREES